MNPTKRLPLLRLGILFFLVILLPAFVWAVMTQRIELRKRAASGEPPIVCWNRVLPSEEGNPVWPDSCKGNPDTQTCTQILMALTDTETNGYQQWIASGSSFLPGCNMPTPTPAPYTPTPSPACKSGVNSFTVDTTCNGGSRYMTFECYDGYGRREGGPTSCKSSEVWYSYAQQYCAGRTNCPLSPTPSPQPECGSCSSNAVCNPGLVCQNVPTPTPNCPYGAFGPCSMPAIGTYQACVKPDGSSRCPSRIISPTPTPLGCYYQQVQCFRAPCDPILVCPQTNCTGPNGSACSVSKCLQPQPCPTGQVCPMVRLSSCTRLPGTCQNGSCTINPPPSPIPCNYTTNPPKLCPTGYSCRYSEVPPIYYRADTGGTDDTRQQAISTTAVSVDSATTAYWRSRDGVCIQDYPRCGPEGSTCTIGSCPVQVCEEGQPCTQRACNVTSGICRSGQCTPNTTPTPPPPPGCFYTRVCTDSYPSNCRTNLVCPQTPTPTPSPTSCKPAIPTFTITNPDQSGNPGDSLTYKMTIRNNDSPACPVSPFVVLPNNPTGFNSNVPQLYFSLAPGQSREDQLLITSSAQVAVSQQVPIIFSALNTRTQLKGLATGWYIVKPSSVPLTFRVKLSGVNTGNAQDAGATLTVKFILKNGAVIPLGDPLKKIPLIHAGNGVYTAKTNVPNPPAPGTEFAVQVTVDKHLAMRFCKKTGQTEPCGYANTPLWMTTQDYTFDFTGRPMPAGDIDLDGRVDQLTDLKMFTDLWKLKSPSEAQVKSADVNYNGWIDQLDFFEILKTLSVRFNE